MAEAILNISTENQNAFTISACRSEVRIVHLCNWDVPPNEVGFCWLSEICSVVAVTAENNVAIADKFPI